AGENGLAGVTIYLDLNANAELDAGDISTVTASDGTYAFRNLPAGDYRVRDSLPDGFRRTTQGNDAGTYFGTALIVDQGQSNYVEIDALTGQVNRIGSPLSSRLHGLIRTNSGEFYGLNGENLDRIFRLNPVDGSLT